MENPEIIPNLVSNFQWAPLVAAQKTQNLIFRCVRAEADLKMERQIQKRVKEFCAEI